MDTTPLRVGIVGAAGRGASFRAGLEANGASVVAVCDVRADKLDQAMVALGASVKYTSYEQMLNTGHLDAVAIGTPMQFHADQSIAALERNSYDCLIVDLDRRLDAGEQLPTMPPWHVQENKWRAARYGTEAIVILDAKGTERLVTDDVLDTVTRLAPVARRLGCSAELLDVAALVEDGASYVRQREVAATSGGDLRAVVSDLVARLRADVP